MTLVEQALEPWAWHEAAQVPQPSTPSTACTSDAWCASRQQQLELALSSPLRAAGAQQGAVFHLAHQLCAQPPSEALRQQADQWRRAVVGDTVTYVVNLSLIHI